MRTKQRNNLAETARHERVAQNTDVYAVKARNYKGLRRGSPVFRRNKWRIPEKTLILSAVIGGSVGAILGMRFFHHKTRKARFAIGVPVILLVQIGVVCLVQWAMK